MNAEEQHTATDDQLMHLVCNGDKQAFAVLLRRHQPKVTGFCTRFLNDRAMAGDMTQEVFLTVWNERRNYTAQGKFVSYLLRIAYLRCQAQTRRHKTTQKYAPMLTHSMQQHTMDTHDVAERIDLRNHSAQAHAHLASLPEQMRQIVILRFAQGHSMEEIAQLTDMPVGTVKSHLHRGLKRLRKLMAGASA